MLLRAVGESGVVFLFDFGDAFETSGVVGSCGFGIELDTFLSVASAQGISLGTNDNINALPGPFCSRVRPRGIMRFTNAAAISGDNAPHKNAVRQP